MAYCTDIIEAEVPTKPAASLASWIRSFFHLRELRRLAISDLQRLSDRELRDIGVNRSDIGAIVDRELSNLCLGELRPRRLDSPRY
jgi:uncharacterized protein YjiS (DUF1127 family)